jgi:hypothetical protein
LGGHHLELALASPAGLRPGLSAGGSPKESKLTESRYCATTAALKFAKNVRSALRQSPVLKCGFVWCDLHHH